MYELPINLISGTLNIILAAVLVMSMARRRNGHAQTETREQYLERQVDELKATVKSLLATDRDRQRRIESLERDLAITRAALAEAQVEIRMLREQLQRYQESEKRDCDCSESRLLVVTGGNGEMKVDLVALRGSGLRITRLSNATYARLKSVLERARRQGEPIQLVHLACHAGPAGIMLDRLVGYDALSEILAGVRILVIMGCQSDQLGDLLSVVQYVIAFREDVPHEEAWQFALLFWRAIGHGRNAEEAFEEAVERGPTSIAEYAELIKNK